MYSTIQLLFFRLHQKADRLHKALDKHKACFLFAHNTLSSYTRIRRSFENNKNNNFLAIDLLLKVYIGEERKKSNEHSQNEYIFMLIVL